MRLGLGLWLGMPAASPAGEAPIIETIVDMRFGAGSPFVAPHTGTGWVRGWGGGGAGLANTCAGGGAACAELTAMAWVQDQSYPYAVGAGGTTGADGGDSTFGDGVTTLCKAVGGKGGTNGGTGGAAASCIGDDAHSGANGAVGTGSRAGGGAAGSSADAAGALGGESDGASNIAGATAQSFGVGGSSQTANSFPGSAGRWIFCYPQLADTAFPWQHSEPTENRDATNTLTRDITLPDAEDGDLLVLVVTSDSETTSAEITMAGDWTRKSQTFSGVVLTVATFVTVKSGATTLTVTTSSSQMATWNCRAIKGSSGVADVEVTATGSSGASANPTPPVHTPTQGSANYMFLVFGGWDSNGAVTFTAFPTGHTSRMLQVAFNTTSTKTATCFTRATGTSHTTGAFGSTTEDNVVGVMSIKAAA